MNAPKMMSRGSKATRSMAATAFVLFLFEAGPRPLADPESLLGDQCAIAHADDRAAPCLGGQCADRTIASGLGSGSVSTLEQSRYLATSIPGPRSKELIERKLAAVSRGIGNTMPVYTARAGGGIIEDVDGNRLIDLGSGIAVTTIGNASPRVVDAVREQVADFTHTCFMITPYEEYVAVAEALNRLTPGTYDKRSALFNSGSEAVENAVKIARTYTRKQAVVSFDHAYHGRTNLTMALTAKSMPYKHGFGPFAPELYRAPLSYPFRDAEFGKEMATDGEVAA